jgi:hypothetical protein
MKNIFRKRNIITVFFIATLVISSVFANAESEERINNADEKNNVIFSQTDNAISVTIPVGDYDITNNGQEIEIFLDGFGRSPIVGMPSLPSRIFAIAIPPGANILDVSFDSGEGILIPEISYIQPVPISRVVGNENPQLYEQQQKKYVENFNLVYSRNDPYPESIGEFVRTAGYRKYNLVDVRITPFTYQPLSGEVVYYPEITVDIKYTIPEMGIELMDDALIATETIAEEIIINYDQTKKWYPQNAIVGNGLHDYVIITLDSLTSSVTSLVDWETAKGRTVEVVTTSWISSNYAGYDLAEKMRNFLREKMPSGEWGIENVLLVGDYDDVPMRRCWQDLGYGKPETDYYFAELSLPDDQSWDADGDHRYGENSDLIDFYTEINVGRIPWSNPDTVQHICEKSALYEQKNDPSFKKNILLLGAFFWPDTDTAVLMEKKVDQSWMQDWTMTRMYEQGRSSYPMDYNLDNNNVVSVWSSGSYAFVNWAGHGSPDACWIYYDSGYFIHEDDCTQLNDEFPSIIFADACSNSDTDYLNIGKAMLKQGGVGFLGSTKVALGRPGWDHPNDGSSQSLDYYFTTSVTSGDYTQGEAHQRALREMYTQGLWSYLKYETFEWGALWGNPDLGMTPVGDVPIIEIGDISGGFGKIQTSASNIGTAEATGITWRIIVKGGILQLINSTYEGFIDTLGIDETIDITTQGLLFGFGTVEITVTIHSSTKTKQGRIIGPFFLLQ